MIDVRPKEEYKYDHIPGTWSIPLQELEQLYCRGRYCVYAAEAVKWFRSQGIKKIRSEDGVREWKELEPIFSW